MDNLLELFCDVDDFCQDFLAVWRKQLVSAGAIQRQRKRSLSMSILIHFLNPHRAACFSQATNSRTAPITSSC